uniref:Nuclear receptor domain-containing protein n=1 Tax=Panagrellus redivivus TaxID=6233 RepID=A0A7E4UWC4_PANRE
MSSSPPDDFLIVKDEECLICGSPTKGLHFQVNACRACAAFFRRSVKSKLVYRCQRGTGRCNLKTKVHGKPLCRYCRMKMCNIIGMRMEVDYAPAPPSPDDVNEYKFDDRNEDNTIGDPQVDGKELMYTTKPLISIIKEGICKNNVSNVKGISIKLSPLQQMCHELTKFCNQNAPKMCDVELVSTINSKKYLKFMENYLLRLVKICTSCEDFVKIDDNQKFPIFRHFYQCFNYAERAYQTMLLFGYETTDLRYLFECTQAIDVGMTKLASGDAKDEEIKQLFEPLKQRMFGHLLNPIKVLRPTIFEFAYIAVNIMWNLTDVSDITSETHDVAKEIVERSANELHNYYKFEVRLPNYSSRHASLLSLDGAQIDYQPQNIILAVPLTENKSKSTLTALPLPSLAKVQQASITMAGTNTKKRHEPV